MQCAIFSWVNAAISALSPELVSQSGLLTFTEATSALTSATVRVSYSDFIKSKRFRICIGPSETA